MSKNRKKIVQAIQGLTAPIEDTVMSGYVKAVDEDKATMSVVLNSNGQVVEDVMLHALSDSLKEIVIVPEQDSDVVICSVDGSGEYTLVQADKIKKVLLDIGSMQAKVNDKIEINCDEIVFNGGENGGMSNTIELKSQLDKTNELLQALVDIINGTPISQPANSNSVLQIKFKEAIVGKKLGDFSKIEDSKITH